MLFSAQAEKNIKRIPIFSQKKNVFPIFKKMELSNPKSKKFQEKTFRAHKNKKTYS